MGQIFPFWETAKRLALLKFKYVFLDKHEYV